MQKRSVVIQVNKMYKHRSALLMIFVLSTLIVGILMKQSQGKPENIRDDLIEERTGSGLYDEEDDVIILNVSNFNEYVYNAQRAWLVEFYNSWCGHCIKFAPTWKEFARSISGWRDMIAVGAVDCADEENTQLCREYEIMGYPTLRYFSVNSSFPERGDGFAYLHSVPELRENIVQKLSSEEVQGKYGNWPSLKTNVNVTDLKDIWSSSTSKEDFIVAVLDSNSSNLAGQLILDLSVNLGVAATKVRKDHIINRVGNSDVYIVYRNLTVIPLNQTIISKEHYTQVYKLLKEKWGTVEHSEKIGNHSSVFQMRKLPLDPKIMANKVFQIDLETAVRYSLYHEISIQPALTGDSLRSLTKYLNVLEKYYPVGMNIPMFIGKVKYEILPKSNLTGIEFKNILEIIESRNSPVFNMKYDWMGCMGSIENRRGYPCGLWVLFHSLTVSAAAKGHLSSTSDEVLTSMAGYIKYFFGCRACSEHFQQMATTISSNVTSLDNSILWLWNAHNMVNKRLAGDASEDPSFPKIQFPSPDVCPECRYDDGRWDEKNVLRYLKNMYSIVQHPISSSQNKNVISAEWKGYKSIDSEDNGEWDVGDVTAIIIFYMLSIMAFVIYAYRFFIRRLPRPKYYNHDIVFPA